MKSGEFFPIGEVYEATREELKHLGALSILSALEPERFWDGNLTVTKLDQPKRRGVFVVDVDYDRKTNTLDVSVDAPSLSEMTDFQTASDQQQEELIRSYLAIGLVHDLTIRALRPERVDDFSERVTNPDSLLTLLMNKKMVDGEGAFSVMEEFMRGDEDRVARLNVFRFALGVTVLAHIEDNPSLGEQMEKMFRPSVESLINNGPEYERTAEEVFLVDKPRSSRMFAEHVDEFELAAVLPMQESEILQFINLYQ
ncbi:MAG TPA: hypothetical protein VJJ78_03145 [Candidatus Saccharimonadales bacterium]|nr:hypothetical protein [Candidatus Saccharimonadales bacterium]